VPFITGTVVGAEAVALKFSEKLPDHLQARLERVFRKLTIDLQKHVVQDKLSGQMLKVKTGTLRRSIDQTFTVGSGGSVTGKVSTNLRYGIAWERGFHGTVNVREHLREIKVAFGKSISPTEVTVHAHSRKVDMKARPFLKNSLADFAADGSIERAAQSVVKGP
jgi:hypothetical protein